MLNAGEPPLNDLSDEQIQKLLGVVAPKVVVDPELRSSRLHWLVTGPVQASPTSVGGEVEKLRFCAALARTAWTCRRCPLSGAATWPRSGAV